MKNKRGLNHQPLLFYISGQGYRQKQTFCSISDPTKTYSTSINPQQSRASICTIQHGWYLMKNNSISEHVSEFFLWYPYDLKKINLPILTHNGNTIANYILSSPPTSDQQQPCYIFLFTLQTPTIYYCQLGDKQWTLANFHDDIVKALSMMWGREFESLDKHLKYLTCLRTPVYCNGCLYANFFRYLVVIEITQPNGVLKMNSTLFNMPSISQFQQPHFQRQGKWMLGSKNKVFQIKILHARDKIIKVDVYIFDCSQRVWEKVKNIKDKLFFISTTNSSFVCQAINPEIEGGRIYIALYDSDFVYIYNIEDDSFVISQSFSNLPKKRSHSRWLMTDISIIDTLKTQIGEAHQIREKESMCRAINLKEMEDIGFNEFALPLDIVESVSKRITNVLDYLHFRATNRLFRQVASIEWRFPSNSMSMSKFDDLSLSPLFVFIENDNFFNFVHPKHGFKYKYIVKNFQKNENALNALNWDICCSKDGWLLLVAAVDSCVWLFFNPFTKEVLPEKPMYSIYNHRCVGVSNSPTSSKCEVIVLNKNPVTFKNRANIYTLSESVCDFFSIEDINFQPYNISPAFHNGLFYYLTIKGKLAVIKATRGEEVSWQEFMEPQPPCSDFFNVFLVECNGNLLSVFEGSFGKWVQIFKLNESTMTWIKVKNLDNYMLFVGNTSFSVVAKIPGMENKIYFPRVYDKSIVFYSLETNNYHTFENNVVNFYHVREHLNSGWIEPRWH